ncbi:MAG: PLP-dependent aminotransferase family protein [Hyphomicrobiaceae bacterium]|nr:PLP-dependent aminotransferase family protein [Hyphomicrobiaceae bacterium]
MLSLDRDDDTPLHRQLYNKLRQYIHEGKLPARARLPATRILADDLGVSRNTVVAAYDALLAEGYLESIPGSGTQLADIPRSLFQQPAPPPANELPRLSQRGGRMARRAMDQMIPGQVAFHPGYPEIGTFPFATWARLLANSSRRMNEDIFGYIHAGGYPKLRSAIADYLSISRGVKCDADQVIVVSGVQAALDLIGRVFMDPGDEYWIEDPGYHGARIAFSNAGGVAVPLRADQNGWALEEFAGTRPRLIFVTPSCQWPMGIVMPLETRLKLLQLARLHDAWIVEDDYDSEYRFRGHPVPSMQGLDESGRVIYVGTLSKMMFPSLRVGYIVVPHPLIETFRTVVSATGHYPSLPIQTALADFIGQGFLAAHLRKMRALYSRRQRYFVKLCRERLDRWLSVDEIDTGMQILGRFRQPFDDGEVLKVARRHNVSFVRMSSQYHHFEPQHGAFFGYAGVNFEQMRAGVERLRKAFEELDALGEG